jgi:hypothetical protein
MRKFLRRLGGRTVALALVGALLVTGAATAAVKQLTADDGVVHACVGPAGVLRIAPARGCTRIEDPLEWNQAGPRGPQGPAGPAGPAGAAGAQGPAGQAGETGPSDTYASFGPIVQAPAGGQFVVSGHLDLPAGQYRIDAVAQVAMEQSGTYNASCRVTFDGRQVAGGLGTVTNTWGTSIPIVTILSSGATTSVDLACGMIGSTAAGDVRGTLTATKVGALHGQ